MAWPDAGFGAGVIQNATLNPYTKQFVEAVCTAINEREAVKGGGRKIINSITRSVSTATVTTSANHDLATGDIVYMKGADQADYNGRHQITVTGGTTFTYSVSGLPTSPATGEMRAYAPTTQFTYNESGDQKFYPSASDLVGLPVSRVGNGQERKVYREPALRDMISSITRSGSTATATTPVAHGLSTGNVVTIFGCTETQYNGDKTITVTGSTTFTYTVSGTPATPATGAPNMSLLSFAAFPSVVSISRGGSTATVTTATDHGIPIGAVVTISGCGEAAYNGAQTVLSTPTSTTFTYAVSGSPSTPASGTPILVGGMVTVHLVNTAALAVGDIMEVSGANETDYNGTGPIASIPSSTTIQYVCNATPVSPATGTILIKLFGRLSRNSTTATVHLPGHGLSIGSIANISGAAQSEYNGDKTVTALGVSPAVSSITRSGSVATVTTGAAHGLLPEDAVIISGCVESAYNGVKIITSVPTATTFTYEVSGSPSTPATGSPACNNISVFQFEVSGSPASPATGDITFEANCHMIAHATHAGGTATYWCFEHGLADGDYIEVVPNQSGYEDWAVFAAISGATANSFNLALAAPAHSAWTHSASYTMHCTPEGMFKRLLREMQTAIGTLVTGGTVLFFEDDGVYSTQWTVSNLLGEGSYGSAWLPLFALLRSDYDAVLTQMREAVELLLVFKTPFSISAIGANTEVYVGTGPTRQIAWDDAIGVSPTDFASPGVKRLTSGSGPYTATIWDNAVFSYELPGNGFGDFIEGTYDMDETLTTGATMAAYDIEDQDANTITLDLASAGTTTHTVSADVDVFGNNPVVEWTIIQSSIPATVPSGSGDRNAGFAGARVTRELTSSDLTYG